MIYEAKNNLLNNDYIDEKVKIILFTWDTNLNQPAMNKLLLILSHVVSSLCFNMSTVDKSVNYSVCSILKSISQLYYVSILDLSHDDFLDVLVREIFTCGQFYVTITVEGNVTVPKTS